MGDGLFMPATQFVDPDAPEFIHIRADLARLYEQHRTDLGLVC